jgi:hypothetical protein
MAENIRIEPKIIYKNLGFIQTAMKAPVRAPIVVAISKNMPTRTFVILSLRYVTAEPLEVDITDTTPAPMAYLISTPNSKVSTGITIIPPPRPRSEPKKPASTEKIRIMYYRR